MTLGNTAFNNQDWQQAIKAFSTAARLEPESVASWNNLAYALHAYGCKTQAKVALQCGLNISPTDENLLDSWQELAVDPVSKDHRECLMIRCY